jgi:hypothetical protein
MIGPRSTAFLLGCLLAIGFLALIEGSFALLNRSNIRYPLYISPPDAPEPYPSHLSWPSTFREKNQINMNPQKFVPARILPTQISEKRFYFWKDNLLTAEAGSYPFKAIAHGTKEEIYNVIYNVNQYGYRETKSHPRAQKFAVFLGDSFTFGIGVNDSETMPTAFARNAPEYHAYNLSFGGYGLHDLWLRAQKKEAKEIVREKNGVIFYVFKSFHIKRIVGALHYVGSWGAPHPYLKLSSEGKVQYMGSFESATPIWAIFSRLLSSSQLVQFFQLDWPIRINQEDARLFAKTVAELRDIHLDQLPNARFVMLLSPGKIDSKNLILRELAKERIELLDYSEIELEKYLKGNRHIPFDGHHTPEANELFGKQLAEDLLRMQLR